MADEVQIVEDKWSYRLIVGLLGGVLIVSVGGIILLPIFGKEAPAELSQFAILVGGGLLAALKLPGK